jgi:hypothetical protein
MDCVPTKVNKGEFQTFYITLSDKPNLVMAYTGGLSSGAVYEDQFIRINSGSAVSYLDSASFDGFNFNGQVRYSLIDQTASPTCTDMDGNVLMDEGVGERSCSWLGENLERFGYVCSFAIPSLHCPNTCNICSMF